MPTSNQYHHIQFKDKGEIHEVTMNLRLSEPEEKQFQAIFWISAKR